MSAEEAPSKGVGAVCVLLCSGEAPGELIASMRTRGVSPVVCRSAFAAMAEICTVGTIGKVPKGGAILLIAEPSSVRGKKALLLSCKKYAPWLRLWVYQHDASIQLRPLEVSQLGIEDDEEDQPNDAIPMHRPASRMGSLHNRPIIKNAPPALRLSGEGEVVNQNPPETGDEPEEGQPMSGRLLTDEELSMLLSDELDHDD